MQRHAAIGDAKVKTGDGRWKAIRGISEGKKIYVKANNGYTAEQIAKHEYFHQAADERVVKGIWEEVKRRYEPEVVEELKRKYEEGYEGCYEGGRKIEEEIAADVYSGMNVFEEVGEEIRRYAEDLLEGKGARQENIDRGGEGSYDGIEGSGNYKTKNIKWGIQNIEDRQEGAGFWGKRIEQRNPRVNRYELKINPNNESYYLPHPNGGYVQFENMVNFTVQDGKLIMKKKSFYHVNDMPDFAKNKVLGEARRQVEAAKLASYKVEWLISDQDAVRQIKNLFKKENMDIKVIYYPE